MTNPIPFETRFQDIQAHVVDIADFNERVVGAYNSGIAEKGLPADDMVARSVIPAATYASTRSATSAAVPHSRNASTSSSGTMPAAPW